MKKQVKCWLRLTQTERIKGPFVFLKRKWVPKPYDGERIVRATLTIDEPQKRKGRK